MEHVASSLSAMENNTNGIGKYISFRLDASYFNEIRSEESTIAERVLSMPEILEHVLLFTDVESVMAMERVNKKLRNIIDASPKLQSAIYLKPSLESTDTPVQRRTAFGRDGSGFQSTDFKVTLGQPGVVNATIHTAKPNNTVPHIGTRWSRMLICQPPIKAMVAAASKFCPNCGSLQLERYNELSSDTGITVGDLYDKVQEVSAIVNICQNCHYDPIQGPPVRLGKYELAQFWG